ncbi:LysR family transcriptional regulator [Vibrio vulnificus]|nr:LysR family transcriptional regulator [Vibrio vulnificus]MCU8173003.1 LysR family transcriptional regulator [Vibrio vulnificus]
MDICLFRTFLEVIKTRHFGQAAENLFVTQAAVSARIKIIENDFDCQLFTRDRNNIQLTSSGVKLQSYAEMILENYKQAKKDIAIDNGKLEQFTIGGTPSIWDSFLQQGLTEVMDMFQELSFAAEVMSRDKLQRGLIDRTLDLAISFDQIKEEGICSQELSSSELIMVSNKSQARSLAFKDNYVYVDWGTRFALEHSQSHRHESEPYLKTSTARIALDFILQKGGSAYLPLNMVKQHLIEQVLFRVDGVDPWIKPVYMACRERDASMEKMKKIKNTLKNIKI